MPDAMKESLDQGRQAPLQPLSLAQPVSIHTLQATSCYACGAAAVHAMGIPGTRAARAWVDSHHVICPKKETRNDR